MYSIIPVPIHHKMEAEHQKAIASNSYFLTQNLDIDDSFLQYLFSKGVMIQQQMDQIRVSLLRKE